MQRLAGKAAAVLLLVALAGSAAIAAPPPGADLRFADWYASLYTAEGSLCCSVADCAPREWRTATDHYEVLIGDRWYPVPPRAVLNRNDNPTGKAVACFYGGEVRCFVKASES